MYVNFDELGDDARIWIWQSATYLEVEKVELISARVISFLDEWKAHGKELTASLQIIYNRFIIVGLDESSYQATGCSIDRLVQLIQKLEQEANVSLLDRMQIAYREEGLIVSVPMNLFRQELENGELNENTIVFNNLIERKSQLENNWEVPVKNSWHKQMLPIA